MSERCQDYSTGSGSIPILPITHFQETLYAGSIQQNIHHNLEQNHLLLKILAKKCRSLGLFSSKLLIRKEGRGAESVNKLHSMVDRYYLQHVGLVSSGQRRKLYLLVPMSGCTFLDFRRMSD
jgi:hypothetical protein